MSFLVGQSYVQPLSLLYLVQFWYSNPVKYHYNHGFFSLTCIANSDQFNKEITLVDSTVVKNACKVRLVNTRIQ